MSRQSPSCLYGATRWGPTSLILGWALPIRAWVKGPVDRWANWWRSTQHSPPWSHLLLLASYVLLLFLFHHRLMHRAVSSSRSVADRFNSYNTLLCTEIDYLTLGPLLSGKHRLYRKPMSTVCSLYTLGGKPLVSGSATTFCHLNSQSISIMIPDFLLYNI